MNNEHNDTKLLMESNELMTAHFGEPQYNLTSEDNLDGTRTYRLEVKGIGIKFKFTDKDPHLALQTVVEAAIWEISRRVVSDMYGSLAEGEIDKEESDKINELISLPVPLISFLNMYIREYEENPIITVGKNKNGRWECAIQSKEAFLKVFHEADTREEAIAGASRRAQTLIAPMEVTLELPPANIQA